MIDYRARLEAAYSRAEIEYPQLAAPDGTVSVPFHDLRALLSEPHAYTKAELEDWCQCWTRTPYTVLRAFIDAGLCSDEAPKREQLRLFNAVRKDAPDA